MSDRLVPSALERLWGWAVVAPSRPVMFLWGQVGLADDEDAFSGGEGGDWTWYPVAGSMRPRPLPRWWRIAGPGAGAVGSLGVGEGRVRFLPTPFWRRRSVPEWERTVLDERRDGAWLVVTTPDGDAVLRYRRGAVDDPVEGQRG
jgi:hypothetical protein